MKFRKKPVVIEAIQFTGDKHSFDAIWRWMDGDDVDSPMCGYEGPDENHPVSFQIKTLEGRVRASAGDWVIKGIKGEFYPCKPDIFAMTYECVPDQSE
jgi:hypothetical protein